MPWTRVVFPAPSGPVSTTRSPARSSPASLVPSRRIWVAPATCTCTVVTSSCLRGGPARDPASAPGGADIIASVPRERPGHFGGDRHVHFLRALEDHDVTSAVDLDQLRASDRVSYVVG